MLCMLRVWDNNNQRSDRLTNMAPSTSIWSVFRRGPLKVSIMGSGNWGSAISRIIGDSAASSYLFHDEVLIWVFDEEFEGKMISKSINEDHQNPKYLPGYKLPSNVRAVTDAVEAIEHADLIVFVLPHQFVVPLCQRLASHVKSHAKAISLVKGLHIHEGQPYLFSDLVTDTLDVDCSVLSGANVANDIARGEFSETTIGYSDKEVASIWQQLFDTPFFRVNGIPDVRGVEVCGAVKNVIALAAGFCDGLGLGSNSKAAIMRMGLAEMKLFALLFFDGILEQTFFDSAGFADVVTTCYGGRNVRCAAEFIRRGSKASWAQIENDMLHGQKLQVRVSWACRTATGCIIPCRPVHRAH
eukprot:Polyplicarium_translucidae@DN2212_c0_g1_i4.p1